VGKWKKFASVALKITSTLVPAMSYVETLGELFTMSSKNKEDKAVEVFLGGLNVAEGALRRDLLNDPEFEKLVRSTMKGIVEIQNFIEAAKNVRVDEDDKTEPDDE